MHGWRARIGLIPPSTNTTTESEFAATLPRGVSLHTARARLPGAYGEAELAAMNEEVERCASLLATADVDVVAYACTSGSFLKGPGYDRDLADRIRDLAEVPVVVTATSVTRACRALGVESIAIHTPYVRDIQRRCVEFFEAIGVDVVSSHTIELDTSQAVGRRHPHATYRDAIASADPSVDAVFLSSTNYRTTEIIQPLEADLGVPVVTSNQATLWETLRVTNAAGAAPGLGALLSEPLPDRS